MINNATIYVYIPIHLPHILDRDKLCSKFNDGIEEFISLIKTIDIEYKNKFKSLLKVKCHEGIDEIARFKAVWEGKPSPWYDFCFLEIKSDFQFSDADVGNYIGNSFNGPFSDKKDLYLHLASEDIAKTTYDLLIAVNIAKHGLITTNRGAIFTDNIYRGSINGTNNNFYEASKIAESNGWPKVFDIPIIKVWVWLNSFDFFKNSIGEGNIGRAVAAISYLLKDTVSDIHVSINLDIIWILIGLEALYGKGNTGLKSQLNEKAWVFLGEPTEGKKKLGTVYDFRSRLIHGDIDIPFSYCLYDGDPKYRNLVEKLEDSRLLVVAVLLSSVQKLILDDKKELNFKYTIV
jgi:hypothetical protein